MEGEKVNLSSSGVFFFLICVSICQCLYILREGGAGLFCLQAYAWYCQSWRTV